MFSGHTFSIDRMAIELTRLKGNWEGMTIAMQSFETRATTKDSRTDARGQTKRLE